MTDDEAFKIRIVQYLLSKEDNLKMFILDRQKLAFRKNPHPDDILSYWYANLKLEIWQEIAGEIWQLLK